MNKNPIPGSPRLDGIYEHFHRINQLALMTKQIQDNAAKYRLMLLAVYSCRAITELMLEAATRQEIPISTNPNAWLSREDLEKDLVASVPYYLLIEKIRIQDFHRFGIRPPTPGSIEVFFGGPVKLTAQNGTAVISIPSTGPQILETGSSKVNMQRPLAIQNGEFFDDTSGKYVGLSDLLDAFVKAIPIVIADFAKKLR